VTRDFVEGAKLQNRLSLRMLPMGGRQMDIHGDPAAGYILAQGDNRRP
jgi:hypothetical protein